MKFGKFDDYWRGDGVFVNFGRLTLALRYRMNFGMARHSMLKNIVRLYAGPLEIEWHGRIK